MSDSLSGALGPPILGGHLLDGAVVFEQDLTVRRLKSVTTLARGRRRESYVYQGAGYPLIGEKRDVVLRYQHLGGNLDLVEEILSLPGPHDVVVWKRVHPAYAGDGDRAEFTLPWRVATDIYAALIPPALQGGTPAAALAPYATIGIGDDAEELVVTVEDQATYDGGDPDAGEAWILEGGQLLKVGTVPAAGEYLHVRVVPVLEMFEAEEQQRKYPAGTLREPRDIALMEQ